MKKMMVIINPAAGRGGYSLQFGEAMKILGEAGYATTLYYTSARGDATEFARRYAREYDIISCVGGDGTLSETLAGLMDVENPPMVGYFPLGTTNDVATTLGLPKNDMEAAARKIVKGDPHPFDVGRFGKDEYFAYIAAFGAFTNVSYATTQEQKKTWGHLAYVLQGMAEIPNIETYRARVEYDTGFAEGTFIYGSMSNSTSVAGLVRLPGEMVCLGDGLSELVLVKKPESVEAFGEIMASVIGGTFDSSNLIIVHTTQAKFTFDKPVAWTRDGEDGGRHEEIVLKNCKSPIELLF